MKFDQFGFEQSIMDCWGIREDLDTLTEGVLEHGMTPDQITNVTLGLKELYSLKFEKLFEMYSESLKQNQ